MNSNFIFLLLVIIVMYVFIFLPQMRRNKKIKKFSEELKKGDKVVTNGGIHGKVTELKDLTVGLDVGAGTTLKIDRSAINMEASELANKQD